MILIGIKTQIEKYGGFYIARYEAGVSDDMQKNIHNISNTTNNIQDIPVKEQSTPAPQVAEKEYSPKDEIKLVGLKKISFNFISFLATNNKLLLSLSTST